MDGGIDRAISILAALTLTAMMVATFAGTAAATAVIAYFFVEVLGSLAVALWWRAAGTA